MSWGHPREAHFWEHKVVTTKKLQDSTRAVYLALPCPTRTLRTVSLLQSRARAGEACVTRHTEPCGLHLPYLAAA